MKIHDRIGVALFMFFQGAILSLLILLFLFDAKIVPEIKEKNFRIKELTETIEIIQSRKQNRFEQKNHDIFVNGTDRIERIEI